MTYVPSTPVVNSLGFSTLLLITFHFRLIGLSMAQQMLERACQRFRDELTDEEDCQIRATSWQDVQHSIVEIERQLAARQCLRNLDRISPYLKAVEGYGAVVDIFCNSSPFVPYVWASNFLFLLGDSHGQSTYFDLHNRVQSSSFSWYV